MTAVLPAAPPRALPARRPFFTVSVWAWVVSLLSIHLVVCVVALPYTLLFDRDRRFAARVASWLTRNAIRIPRNWRGGIRALSSIRLDRPAVVVMNHRSLADTAIAVGMPGAPRIVSKPWAGKVPLLGANMRLCGHVLFDPASPRSVREMMTRVEGLISRGESVLFFPEGTRQTSSRLGPFHEGAFRVAVKTGVDVLPVVLHGMGELVPRGSFAFHDVVIDVTPLARIPPGDDRRELARRVREAMSVELRSNDPGLAQRDLNLPAAIARSRSSSTPGTG